MNNNEICTKWIKCEHCRKYEECFKKELLMERKKKNKEQIPAMKKAFWEKEGGASEVL